MTNVAITKRQKARTTSIGQELVRALEVAPRVAGTRNANTGKGVLIPRKAMNLGAMMADVEAWLHERGFSWNEVPTQSKVVPPSTMLEWSRATGTNAEYVPGGPDDPQHRLSLLVSLMRLAEIQAILAQHLGQQEASDLVGLIAQEGESVCVNLTCSSRDGWFASAYQSGRNLQKAKKHKDRNLHWDVSRFILDQRISGAGDLESISAAVQHFRKPRRRIVELMAKAHHPDNGFPKPPGRGRPRK